MELRSGRATTAEAAKPKGKKSKRPLKKKRSPKVGPPEKKSSTYCGNNATVLNNGKVAGTPYSCMQKGYAYGRYHMPLDDSYGGEYEQLMPRKIWCGKRVLSAAELRRRGYDYNGILPECLRYGLGAGRRDRALIE